MYSVIYGNPPGLSPLLCGSSGHKITDVGCDKRLCKTDATYVDVIHTSNAFGIVPAIGHADYYPNGGYRQAGKHYYFYIRYMALVVF